MNYEKIRVEAGPIYRIWLNDPDRRNVLGATLIFDLLAAIEDAHSSGARVIVLGGEGTIFSAGGDLSAFGDGSGRVSEGFTSLLVRMMKTEVPIVARIHGHALGGGLGLVAASTFAVASSAAQFATPEVQVGLFPMMIMAVLVRVVPRRALVEMMLLGERMKADRAKELGLVSDVVNPEDLDERVRVLADKLAQQSPAAVRRGLAAFAAQEGASLDTALPMLAERLLDCAGTEDAREGLLAFSEKRKPQWTGR